jgi:hypothetical protein
MSRPIRLRPLVGLVLGGLLCLPSVVHSHQRELLHVGQSDYLLVIGSLNEPVYTGDKTGVDLTVLVPDPTDPMDSRAQNVKPVEGLEKTLKVEVKAGPHARVFDLYPRFREPGKYDAVFYPTVATTYSYRVFGTVNGTPFDVTFACSPAGHVATEDKSVVKVSNEVTRKGLRGSFGCPRSRSEAEFPPTR